MDEYSKSILRLNRSHEKMRTVIAKIDPEREISQGWKIKEVLAHIAGWDEFTIKMMRVCMLGPLPDNMSVRSFKEFNADSVEARAHLTLSETIDGWEEARQRMIETVKNSSEKHLCIDIDYPWGGKGNMHKVLEIMAEHEASHARQIARMLNG